MTWSVRTLHIQYLIRNTIVRGASGTFRMLNPCLASHHRKTTQCMSRRRQDHPHRDHAWFSSLKYLGRGTNPFRYAPMRDFGAEDLIPKRTKYKGLWKDS